MKAHWRSTGTAQCILDLDTRWKWAVSFTPRPLYPQGKSPRYPLDRRVGGPQSRSGCGGEENNSQPLPGLEPPDHPAHSPALYHLNTIRNFKSRSSGLWRRVVLLYDTKVSEALPASIFTVKYVVLALAHCLHYDRPYQSIFEVKASSTLWAHDPS
jgi:hypothetical protein